MAAGQMGCRCGAIRQCMTGLLGEEEALDTAALCH